MESNIMLCAATCTALGMPTYMDTQAFEHEHIEDGVNAYKRTSKRKDTTTREMLLHALQMKRANEIYNLSELNDQRNDYSRKYSSRKRK